MTLIWHALHLLHSAWAYVGAWVDVVACAVMVRVLRTLAWVLGRCR